MPIFTLRRKLLAQAIAIVAAAVVLLGVPWPEAWRETAFGLLLAFAVLVAVVTARSASATILELARATRRIGDGEYDVPVRVRGADEVARLAREIDRMRTQLREKVRLLEELRRELERKVEARTAELKHAHDQLSLLYEVTNTVNSSLDFHAIFDAVVSGTRRLVDFEQASVARCLDTDQAIIFAISGGHPELSEGRTIPLRGSRIEQAVKSRVPAVFDRPRPDVQKDTLLMSAIVREVVLPLTVGDHVIGTFNLGSRRRNAFSGSELEVLVQIAGVLAVALLQAEAYERERDAARKLKELSDLKSDFVSRVSHELRTPLTSILGAVDNLLDGIAGPLAAKSSEYLVRVRNNGTRLLELINDLLDLSRIEAGEERIVLSRFPVQPLVLETAESLRPLADERGIRLEAQADPSLTLVADRDKVTRILVNLLHNAIKFTESGGRIEVRAGTSGDGLVDLMVRDTGIGIPAEEVERIFDKFHQVRRTRDGRARGSGLGLAITRELVTMHGGDIAVKSIPSRGSTFTVRLPIAPRLQTGP